MANTKVTGDLIADGTLTATNLANSSVTTDKLANSSVTAAKLNSITTDNISEGTNLFYTDARVGTYLSGNGYDTSTNIIATITDSAPTTLDTLNELAAALGDDPNFATTVTNSIATKLPLAGGTISGNLTVSGSLTGTLATAAQPTITSVGTLSSLAVSGDLTVDTDTLKVDSANNRVGIGTASPSSKLDILRSSSDRTTLSTVLSVSSQGHGPYTGFGGKISFKSNIYYGSATGAPDGIIETAYIGAVMASDYENDSDLVFGTRQSATTVDEKMRITSSGKVGIGTTSPSAQLHTTSVGVSSGSSGIIERVRNNYYVGFSAKNIALDTDVFKVGAFEAVNSRGGAAIVRVLISGTKAGSDHFASIYEYTILRNGASALAVTEQTSIGRGGLSAAVSGNDVVFTLLFADYSDALINVELLNVSGTVNLEHITQLTFL
jgi:hypothetical protein